jgi:D-alanine-D-alanine ligase-like ATP-grasp enzyme
MYICILNIDYQNIASAGLRPGTKSDPAPFLKEHSIEYNFLRKKDLHYHLHALIEKRFDLYFNLCDGAKGEDIPGIEVVQLLEKANVAFTGADSSFYEPSRLQMKNACSVVDVAYPPGVMISTIDNFKMKTQHLKFPLIVKHPNSFNSIGLTRDSVVYDQSQLELQLKIMINNYDGAFVEEYINGREFTALIAEDPHDAVKPVVFEPMEIIFPEGETFKHFDLKWKSHNSMKYIRCSDDGLAQNISNASSSMFKEMKGKGYARCDLRMNDKGELFMLEINPNCSIYFPPSDPASSDEILFSEFNGHQLFTDLILKSAFNRTSLKTEKFRF